MVASSCCKRPAIIFSVCLIPLTEYMESHFKADDDKNTHRYSIEGELWIAPYCIFQTDRNADCSNTFKRQK